MQVLKVGETALAGIMRLVAEAHASRSRAQALADRAAYWLTILAILAGTVTLVARLALDAPPWACPPAHRHRLRDCLPARVGAAIPW